MAPEQALRQMLGGSGLSYQFTSVRAVTVSATVGPTGAVMLDPVQVQGYPVPPQAMIDNLPPPYAGGQVATGGQLGVLGNRSVMDTPFNQTSYTAKKAEDQQAKTVRDVMIDDPNKPAWAGNFFVGMPAPAGAVTVLLPLYIYFLGMPRLAFVAPTPEGKNLIWVRPLNGMAAQPLAGTESARQLLDRVPTLVGDRIVAVANDAFQAGLTGAMALAAGVAALSAVLVFFLGRSPSREPG